MSELSRWNHIVIHERFIEVDTGTALLIRLPKTINSLNWGIWMPRKLVSNSIEKYRKQLIYPDDFKFRALPLQSTGNERRELHEKEILEQFKSVEVHELDLKFDLDSYIHELRNINELLKNNLLSIQELNGCPETIDALINEVNLSDYDVLIENITLAKERWFQ